METKGAVARVVGGVVLLIAALSSEISGAPAAVQAQTSFARIALQRVRSARNVVVAVPMLAPGTLLESALLARPRNNKTQVVLGDGFREVARLRRAGIGARLRPGMHLEAVVADDAVFLANGPWTLSSLILRADVEAPTILRAVNGRPDAMQTFATRREEALALELAAFGPCLTPIAAETGAFDADSPVVETLDLCARRGRRVRLIVGDDSYPDVRRRSALARLQEDGVLIRARSTIERLALGTHAWASSADAVLAYPDALEWGAALPDLTRTVSDRFEHDWGLSRDLAPTL